MNHLEIISLEKAFQIFSRSLVCSQRTMAQIYDVSTTPAHLRQAESLNQMIDSLMHLELVVNDIFTKITENVLLLLATDRWHHKIARYLRTGIV